MRSLFLLRGVPGSGKSTWIKNNGLEPYTLSADNIRTMFQSPVINECGDLEISQDNDGCVWKLLMQLLQRRMSKGELVIVDATHYRNNMFSRYKKIAQRYRYRVYAVDFSDVPLSTALSRNRARDKYKFVPEEHIVKMNAMLQLEHEPRGWVKLITRNEAIRLINSKEPFDYNGYDKLTIFGDIHGCYDPLKEWFDKNPFSEKTAYIFTGDYIDRGLQNKETLEFLSGLTNKKNVLFLEGNHERWLRLWLNYGDEALMPVKKNDDFDTLSKHIYSRQFIKYTLPEIKDMDIKPLKEFCQKLGQYAYVSFGDKNIFVCHGGIPVVPDLRVSTEQLINGTGKYNSVELLYYAWKKKNNKDTILVHAHRSGNVKNHAQQSENIYSLCEEVEFGGKLRVLTITKDETGKTHDFIVDYVKNNNPAKRNVTEEGLLNSTDNEDNDSDSIVDKIRSSKYVIRKKFNDGFSSYNFSRYAFNKRIWNNVTCKARGLFIDDSTDKVVMRSYDKFFAINEMPETKLEHLKERLVFPLNCFKKENGFLLMMAYVNGKLQIASKSTVLGDYVGYGKEVFEKLPQRTQEKTIEYLKNNDATMVFECISKKDNTHPIYYTKEHLYLLDIIENNFVYKKEPYWTVKQIAEDIGLEYKKLLVTFNSYDEFLSFKKDHDSESAHAYEPSHEGFVFEDANGFMFKYKLPFYRFWKYWRRNIERIKKDPHYLPPITSKRDVDIYATVKDLLNTLSKEEFQKLSIVDVEKHHYKDKLVAAEYK